MCRHMRRVGFTCCDKTLTHNHAWLKAQRSKKATSGEIHLVFDIPARSPSVGQHPEESPLSRFFVTLLIFGFRACASQC